MIDAACSPCRNPHNHLPPEKEDGCEGSDTESTAKSISKDDLLGLPKWTAEDSGGETIRASREAQGRKESWHKASAAEHRRKGCSGSVLGFHAYLTNSTL